MDASVISYSPYQSLLQLNISIYSASYNRTIQFQGIVRRKPGMGLYPEYCSGPEIVPEIVDENIRIHYTHPVFPKRKKISDYERWFYDKFHT